MRVGGGGAAGLLSRVEVPAVPPGEGRGPGGEEGEEENQVVTLTHLVVNCGTEW